MTEATIVNHVAFNITAGSKLPDNVGQLIDTILLKKDEVKVGPLTLLDLMLDDGVDMSAMPVVGSRGGNNPHYYPLPDGKKDQEGDAFVDRYKGTESGKKAVLQLEDIKMYFHKDTLGKTNLFVGRSETWMKDEKARLTAAIKAGGALLEKAVACYQQEERFEKIIDPKKVFFSRNWEDPNADDDKLVLKRTRTPYIMADAKQPTNAMRLTIEQFIALDIPTATTEANGGTYNALKATLSTGAGDGTGKPLFKLAKVNDMYAVFSIVADFLRVDTEEGKKRVERFDLSLQDKDHSKSNILAFGDFVMAIDRSFENVAEDYRKYSAQRNRETQSLAKDENKNKVPAAS